MIGGWMIDVRIDNNRRYNRKIKEENTVKA